LSAAARTFHFLPPEQIMSLNQPLTAYWDNEAAIAQEPAVDWLWQGLLGRGNITLLTSLWKSGKTTLLAQLLSRRKHGGTLAGLTVAAGKTAVITEESRAIWAERIRRLDFGGQVCLFSQPFPRIPSAAEWQALIDQVAALHDQHGVDLAVIDPLAHFVRQENTARGMLDTLMPLRALTQRGMGVLVLHHPAKTEGDAGKQGRGNGALPSHIDIAIEMRHGGADADSRARRLFCQSRHAATPRHLLMEMTPAGDDYVRLPDADDEGFHEHWDVLRMVLEDAPQELTRHDILDEWPPDYPKPNAATLWRWLKRAADAHLVLTAGTGRKTDPYRYWLPTSEARWRAESPIYDIMKKQEQELKLPFVSLREKKRG
jgi:AAA domain